MIEPISKIHADFILSQKLLYDRCNLKVFLLKPEKESDEYGACSFEINNKKIRFRVSKITPTKIGAFVTVWKRVEKGPIQPYDSSDDLDYFVISARSGNRFGQFVFPKSVLVEKDIISLIGKGGKRGIRVYPSWDKAINKQAIKTQEWQLKYFLELPKDTLADCDRALNLYSKCN